MMVKELRVVGGDLIGRVTRTIVSGDRGLMAASKALPNFSAQHRDIHT
jgi:hypothetical protein